MRSHDRIQLQGLWGLTLLDLAKNLAFARLGPDTGGWTDAQGPLGANRVKFSVTLVAS
jgi:hypothetical protein